VIKPQADAGVTAKTTDALIVENLKNTLPKQDNSLSFLSALKQPIDAAQLQRLLPSTWINTDKHQSISRVITLLSNWIKSRPELNTLQPQNISQAIKQSGVFLEHNLALTLPETRDRATPDPSIASKPIILSDTKNLLLNILDAIALFRRAATNATKNDSALDSMIRLFVKQLLPKTEFNPQKAQNDLAKLEQLVNSALAKISAQQLQNLSGSRAETPSATWFGTDIILRHDDILFPVNLYFKSQHEKKNKNEKHKTKERHWTLFLQWELPDSGCFHAELSLKDKNLSGKIWIENRETRARFKQHLGTLHKRFAEKNIDLTRMEYLDAPLRAPVIKNASQIIDINT
jgi:hypothetical protein